MPDVFSREKRSKVMRSIRSRDTQFELLVRREFDRRGLRYRTNYGPNKIDVAFPAKRVAVFLDSCFWHYCPVHRELPKTNRRFWKAKLERNRSRDFKTTRLLRSLGW